MWRHIVPLLPNDIPLFIPDLPGYGRSGPLSVPHSKVNQGAAILSALSQILPSNGNRPLVLVGHDRGARICHRLAVDAFKSDFPILRAVLLDIVPTLVQWRSFADPKGSMGSFHWPFLANVELATAMIQSQGGDVWTRTCLDRWAGKSENGLIKLKEHGAMDVYSELFKVSSVIQATCDDYRAGAEEDVELQEDDQRSGRKVDIDLLVIYSEDYLGKRYNMREVWRKWMKDGSEHKLYVLPVGEGAGHFIAEEASNYVARGLLDFYNV
jgi:pimeloyl-ACP methyl ester carboxylesterase